MERDQKNGKEKPIKALVGLSWEGRLKERNTYSVGKQQVVGKGEKRETCAFEGCEYARGRLIWQMLQILRVSRKKEDI